MLQLPKLATPVRLRSPAPLFNCHGVRTVRSKITILVSLFTALLFVTGCTTVKLPSEDIEVPVKYRDIIAILKSDKFPADSKEKYEAAKELISKVDLYFTRELKTVNNLFNYKDMLVDSKDRDNPVFSFNYRYRDNYIRIRFFSHKMFVTRVEISENGR